MVPSITHGYDDGVEGLLVPATDGVNLVSGLPVFSAVSAAHGAMGWISSGPRHGGRLCYQNPSSAGSSGSVYLTPGDFTTGATMTAVAFAGTAEGSSFVKIRLRSDHRFDVVDAGSARLGISEAKWTAGERVRLDWQQSWDGSKITLVVWFYLGANREGWRPDGMLVTVVSSPEPAACTLGQAFNKAASLGFDTYREYDIVGMPAPFGAEVGAISVHTFDDGVAGRRIRVKEAGAELVRRVAGNPAYSTVAAMHGPLGVLIPATPKGGTIGYDNPYPPEHSGSVYLRTLTRGSTYGQAVTVKNGSTPIVALTIAPSGNLSITDSEGTTLAETTTPAELGHWTRVDWQAVWDGATLAITARYFAEFAEGVDGYQEISASLPAGTTPDSLELGSSSGTWEMHLDTFRTYGDVSVWPEPYLGPDLVVQYSMPGLGSTAGATEAVISSAVLNATTLDFGWSTSIDESENLAGEIAYVGALPVDADGSVHHQISGLTASTTYYGLLATEPGVFIGELVKFKTLPGSAVPFTVKVAFGSCQQGSGDAVPTAWVDCQTYDPDLLVDVGDYGYWGGGFHTTPPFEPYTKHMEKYAQQTVNLPAMRKVRQRTITLEMADDHEYSGNNEDSFNSVVRENSMIAMRKVFALHPLADVSEPKRGLWGAFNVGDNIRVVMLDCISMDRSPGAALDPPETGLKTFLGEAQLAWWKTEMQRPEILKIVIGGKALLGDYPTGRDKVTGLLQHVEWDKFWAYPTERQAMCDFIADNTTTAGGAINVDWWGGDRHANCYVSAAFNPLGDFPVLVASGWDQHGLPGQPGEAYELAYGYDPSKAQTNHQYLQIELDDDGAGRITRTVRSREAHGGTTVIEPGWLVAGTPSPDVADSWTFDGGATEPRHLFSLAAGATAEGVLVTTALGPKDPTRAVDLAVSTSPDMSDSTLTGLVTADSDSLVQHTVTGKAASTTYYAQPADESGARFGHVHKFRTLPATGVDWSVKIMLGSCQANANGSVSQLAWTDILAWEPDLLMHVGDWGYWGGSILSTDPYTKDLTKYRASMAGLPPMAATMQCAAIGSVCISDHELSDNGDPPGGIFNSPHSVRELAAFEKLMPIGTWGDTREPRRGRYYSYDIGDKVRVITLDFRTPDRSNALDADGVNKKMLGDVQMAWLLATLDLTKVNLICFESNWLATPYPQNPGSPSADKPWNYFNDQQIIAAFITAGGYKVAWLGGDRHYVGYLSGANNTLGGFPCYIGSGFEKNGLPLSDGERLDWQYGVDPTSPRTTKLVLGYMQLVLSYVAGTGVVTLTGTARITDTQTDHDPTHWVMSSPPDLTATDTWTP